MRFMAVNLGIVQHWTQYGLVVLQDWYKCRPLLNNSFPYCTILKERTWGLEEDLNRIECCIRCSNYLLCAS